VRHSRDMRIAKVSGFRSSGFLYAVAALCLLAALTAARAIPMSASRSTWKAASATLTRANTRKRRFSSRMPSRSMPLRRRPLQACSRCHASRSISNAYQSCRNHRNPARSIRRHLDMANLLISAVASLKPGNISTCSSKNSQQPEVYLARASYDAAANNTAAPSPTCKRRSNWIPPLRLVPQFGHAANAGAAVGRGRASFKKAVDLNPKSASSLLALGNFYQTRGRFPERSRCFTGPLTPRTTSPARASRLPACIWPRTNRQAEDFLRQAKKDFPSNSVGYRMLGDFYYATTSSIKHRRVRRLIQRSSQRHAGQEKLYSAAHPERPYDEAASWMTRS